MHVESDAGGEGVGGSKGLEYDTKQIGVGHQGNHQSYVESCLTLFFLVILSLGFYGCGRLGVQGKIILMGLIC